MCRGSTAAGTSAPPPSPPRQQHVLCSTHCPSSAHPLLQVNPGCCSAFLLPCLLPTTSQHFHGFAHQLGGQEGTHKGDVGSSLWQKQERGTRQASSFKKMRRSLVPTCQAQQPCPACPLHAVLVSHPQQDTITLVPFLATLCHLIAGAMLLLLAFFLSLLLAFTPPPPAP